MKQSTLLELELILSQMPRGNAPEWSDTTSKFYAAALRSLTDEQVKAAISYLVLHTRFRPAPADIYECAHQIYTDQPDTAAQALTTARALINQWPNFDRVETRMRKEAAAPPDVELQDGEKYYVTVTCTTYRPGPPPADTDPLVIATIMALGGYEHCSTSYEPGVFTAQFERLYKAMEAQRGTEDMQALRLDVKRRKVPQIGDSGLIRLLETDATVSLDTEPAKHMTIGDIMAAVRARKEATG